MMARREMIARRESVNALSRIGLPSTKYYDDGSAHLCCCYCAAVVLPLRMKIWTSCWAPIYIFEPLRESSMR